MNKLLLIVFFLAPFIVTGQTYNENLLQWRKSHIASQQRGNYLMKPSEIENLRYFEPDEDYCVHAKFTPAKVKKQLVLQSGNGGKKQVVKEYGCADFELMSTPVRLHIYKLVNPGSGAEYELFIPFSDPTNGTATFRGGRYLNIDLKDFSGNMVTIDFNKCYNSHAAYERGYSYVIPPGENHLKLEINAGEKAYGEDPGF